MSTGCFVDDFSQNHFNTGSHYGFLFLINCSISLYNQPLNKNITVEPYLDYISRMTINLAKEDFKNTYTNLDANGMNTKISELLAIYDRYGDDESVLVCSRELYKNKLLSVLNLVSDYYNYSFYAQKIDDMVIVVVNSDNEPLTDMYAVSSQTLWNSVEDFIEDTEFYNRENSCVEFEIKTYAEARKYWDDMGFRIITNYCE